MHAERIMTSKPVTIRPDVRVDKAIGNMHPAGHRILPVIDDEGTIKGVLTSASIIARLLPEYIASGELENISFVPDLGVLRKHYLQMKNHRVDECMDDRPVLVNPNESLLAITAALVHENENKCVLVADADKHLLGLITPSDVLRTLRELKLDEAHDA
ncbi:MAG: CBS domain-containing protein [Mariprofundaceae bacterium]|nr:CBS domain-containing protein [Mariprofundaceae bacterium]